MTQIRSSRLIHAFESTDYLVHVGDQWQQINIGAPGPAPLRHWLTENCASPCAWIITACNPDAEQLDDCANKQRNAALKACLESSAQHYVAANSRAHDDNWPDEPGVCVLDMDEGLARALALRFGQAAIVAVPVEGPAQLVWINAHEGAKSTM